MNTTLKKLKNIYSENCNTIILNTHRTKPGYLKDELTLKNLIKEAEDRLMADTSKRDATALADKLKTLAAQIDHSHNLESLLLFVNHDIAEFTRLPIQVTDRVIIDNTFTTRDLVRGYAYGSQLLCTGFEPGQSAVDRSNERQGGKGVWGAVSYAKHPIR
ncbi:MAG: hypothetical protein R3361_01125 [Aequorivita vladivostokensis]|nr:hypothetical protein [Aequorivita vladivostokensis]